MTTDTCNLDMISAGKANAEAARQRHVRLQQADRGLLLRIDLESQRAVIDSLTPRLDLSAWDPLADPLAVAQNAMDRALPMIEARRDYPDDEIPYVSPRFGTGIFAGMLLGQVTFSPDTSWVEPLGLELEQIAELDWQSDNRWWEVVLQSLVYLHEQLADRAFVFLEGYHGPLEFLEMLRGSMLYLDLMTDPEAVHAALQHCDQALTQAYRRIEAEAPSPLPGKLARTLWMPDALPFLSDDSNVLVSAEHYAEFGKPYDNAMFERFGGGFLHVHTSASHQRDNLMDMDALTIFHWRQDPKTPRPIEDLDALMPAAKRKIVMISATADEIRQHIDRLAEGRLFVQVDCRDQAEMNEIVELVRQRASMTSD